MWFFCILLSPVKKVIRGQQGMTFFKEEALLWIMDLSFGQNDGLKLKCLTDGFVSYKHAAFHITRHHCQLFGLSF